MSEKENIETTLGSMLKGGKKISVANHDEVVLSKDGKKESAELAAGLKENFLAENKPKDLGAAAADSGIKELPLVEQKKEFILRVENTFLQIFKKKGLKVIFKKGEEGFANRQERIDILIEELKKRYLTAREHEIGNYFLEGWSVKKDIIGFAEKEIRDDPELTRNSEKFRERMLVFFTDATKKIKKEVEDSVDKIGETPEIVEKLGEEPGVFVGEEATGEKKPEKSETMGEFRKEFKGNFNQMFNDSEDGNGEHVIVYDLFKNIDGIDQVRIKEGSSDPKFVPIKHLREIMKETYKFKGAELVVKKEGVDTGKKEAKKIDPSVEQKKLKDEKLAIIDKDVAGGFLGRLEGYQIDENDLRQLFPDWNDAAVAFGMKEVVKLNQEIEEKWRKAEEKRAEEKLVVEKETAEQILAKRELKRERKAELKSFSEEGLKYLNSEEVKGIDWEKVAFDKDIKERMAELALENELSFVISQSTFFADKAKRLSKMIAKKIIKENL